MIKTAYQTDGKGYFVGEVQYSKDLLPAGAVIAQPEIHEGYIPQWVNNSWVQVENHVGEEGFVNNEPFEIKEYGPYPNGWTKEKVYTLEETKKQKKQEINQARDAEESSTFTYLGKSFDCDTVSYQRMLGANDLAIKTKGTDKEASFSLVWTLADNTHLQMNINEVLGMVPAFASFSNGLHVKASELKDKVDKCKTKECVQSITW